MTNETEERKEELKEFKELQKKNTYLRRNINKYVDLLSQEEIGNFWNLINDLIENEIEQESYCNQ
jgi:hypothetical protein